MMRFLISLGWCLLLISCSTTRLIRPLNKGEMAVSADVGGPIVGYPLPLSSVAVAYGAHEKVSPYAGIHVTPAFFSTLQWDLGANIGWVSPKKWQPGCSSNIVLNGIHGFRNRSFHLYPELSVNCYWELKGVHRPYLSLQSWWDPQFNDTELDKGKLIHPALNVGYQLHLKKWDFNIEAKCLNFNRALMVPQQKLVTFGGNGALGVYLKAAFRFNVKKIKE